MQSKIFKSEGFIFSLTILLLNDFILKYSFPSWWTGKLSDFTGLFVFALFWMAFFPKHQLKIIGLTTLGFIWWKSPLSQSFIEIWNNHIFFPIDRVIDYTDLIALSVLYLAWKYFKTDFKIIRVSPIIIIVCSCFAFCATSVPKPEPFKFPNPQITVFKCSIDSTSIFDKDIYIGNFHRDSNGIFKSRENILEKKVFQGDSIFMIKKLMIEIYNHLDPIDKKSGNVIFEDQIIKRRKERVQNQLKETHEFPLKEIQFSSREEMPKSNKIAVPHITPTLSLKDSFQTMTSQFGALEKLNFLNSELHGEYIRYWDSTAIEIQGTYENGLEQGTWTFYSARGEKEKEEVYEKGLLQNRTLFYGGKTMKDSSIITKQQVTRIHIFFLIFFILSLIGSLILFYKFFKSEQPKAKEKISFLNVVQRIVFSIGGALGISISNIYVMGAIFYVLEIFYWDLPTDLDNFFLWLFVSCLFPFAYFIITNRFRDFIFVWIWLVLGILIFEEIQFFISLFSI